MEHPEFYSNFYKNEKLGFDLILVKKAFEKYKDHFIGKSCLELGPALGYMTSDLVNFFKRVVAVEGSETLFKTNPNYCYLEKQNSFFEDFSTS